MTNEGTKSEIVVADSKKWSLMPKSLTEAMQYAEMIAKSDVCPKPYQGKPGDVVIAIQFGMEVGLSPLQALQNVACINGRPTIWGDAMLGLVQASSHFEFIEETDNGTVATCKVKRRGMPNPTVRTFSMDEAKQAGLAGKQGPWSQYPKRMRQMRARAFALRDAFADVLKGVSMREEVDDYEPIATTAEGVTVEMPRKTGDPKPPPQASAPSQHPESSAAPTPQEQNKPSDEPPKPPTDQDMDILYDQAKAVGLTKQDVADWFKSAYPSVKNRKELSVDQYKAAMNWIEKTAAAKTEKPKESMF